MPADDAIRTAGRLLHDLAQIAATNKARMQRRPGSRLRTSLQ
jgi:hypothetical protein